MGYCVKSIGRVVCFKFLYGNSCKRAGAEAEAAVAQTSAMAPEDVTTQHCCNGRNCVAHMNASSIRRIRQEAEGADNKKLRTVRSP